MAITYDKIEPDDDLMGIVESLLKKNHPELHDAGVSVECLWALSSEPHAPAVKLHGYPCYAVIKVVSLVDRVMGCRDVRITIDQGQWEDLSLRQREALIDHELEHVVLVKDKRTGILKHDDLGRPKVRMKLHDWQLGGFHTIARRHKEAALEVRHMIEFVESEGGQYVMQFAGAGPDSDRR